MVRKIFLFIGIYLLTSAHSGVIEYEDQWHYSSWNEGEGSLVLATLRLIKSFGRFNSLNFFFIQRQVKIEIHFIDHEKPMLVSDTQTPLFYSFGGSSLEKLQRFQLIENGTKILIDDQKIVRNWLNRVVITDRLQMELIQQNGVAYPIDIDLSKGVIPAAFFTQDCEHQHK